MGEASRGTRLRVVDTKAIVFLLPAAWGAWHVVRMAQWNIQELAAGRGFVFSIPTMIVALVCLGLGVMILRQNPLFAEVDPATKAVTCWRGILGRSDVVEAAGEGVEGVVLRTELRRRGRKTRRITFIDLRRGSELEELLADSRGDQLRDLAGQLASALGVAVEEAAEKAPPA